MKTLLHLLSLIVLIGSVPPAYAESVYERIKESGTIRCGYIPYPPAMIIDLNTGEKSGIFYDSMNEIGRRLSLKVEWVQESGWGTFIQDLKTDRFDMMCSTAWTNSARAREAIHTVPLYYSAVKAWTAADDDRFIDNLDTLNTSDYLIAALDGSISSAIARMDFPKARTFSLPEMSSISDVALTVSAGKADVAFMESYIAEGFIKSNPGSLKAVSADPIRIYGNAMYMKKGEHDLRLMINDAIEEISNSPFLPNLFDKYNVPEGSYLRYKRQYY